MFYTIRHSTRFRYTGPVSESIMEVRMQPRSDATQRGLSFQLRVHPRTRVHSYRDYLGNTVHHFDVPGNHRQLSLSAEALVEVQPDPILPDACGPDAWTALDDLIAGGDFIEMLMPSQFTQPSELLDQFACEIGVPKNGDVRQNDPLALLLRLNTNLHAGIWYTPKSTRVDSPIDHALKSRQGVCQDYAHILITLVRGLGIPCRYVSGYLHHTADDKSFSADGATHAWVEALLPEIGWLGLDPTNDMIAGQRHIRTAVGRDYSDVPPTKGVFKGSVDSQLMVAVSVVSSDFAPTFEPDLRHVEDWSKSVQQDASSADLMAQQEQQQQQ